MDMLTNDAVLREEVVTRIFDEGIAEMSVIAFKNIPAELLMQLMQLMQ